MIRTAKTIYVYMNGIANAILDTCKTIHVHINGFGSAILSIPNDINAR